MFVYSDRNTYLVNHLPFGHGLKQYWIDPETDTNPKGPVGSYFEFEVNVVFFNRQGDQRYDPSRTISLSLVGLLRNDCPRIGFLLQAVHFNIKDCSCVLIPY